MSEYTCSTCGRSMHGDECVHCRAATAFAKPEDAEQAKVTPPVKDDGAIRVGLPPIPHEPKDWPWIYVLILIMLLPSAFICLGVSGYFCVWLRIRNSR